MKYKLKKELKDEAKQTRINTNKINYKLLTAAADIPSSICSIKFDTN